MMGDGAAIKRIHIENIFDMYNYDIDLKYDGNICYLIAPNGFGKTTILNMIEFIYRPFLMRNYRLLGIPFYSIDCTLEDGKHLSITKRKVEETNVKRERTYKYSSLPDGRIIDRVLYADERIFLNYNGHEVDSAVVIEQCLEETGLPYREKTDDGYEISSRSEREREAFLYDLNRRINDKIKEEMEKSGCKNDSTFIEADRLSKKRPVVGNYSKESVFNPYASPLEGMYKRLNGIYSEMSMNYGKNLDMAKDKFLSSIFADDDTSMDFDDFCAEWNEYQEKYKRFAEIGIVDTEKNRTLLQEIDKDRYDKKAKELTSYIDAFSHTFDGLEDNYKKLKKLIDIFNERNAQTGKSLAFVSEKIAVTLANGENKLFTVLSSGEKNDLMMFYELIFDVLPGSLVLIDEPEISLNINWQEEFGSYLQEICEINNLHAIVVTHSPHIINGRVEAITVIDGRPGEKDQV